MNNKIFYLSGGMSAFGKDEFDKANEWRVWFKERIERTMNGMNHLFVFNPNDYYNFKSQMHDSEREAMEYDLAILRKADVVIVNFNDPRSIGTAMELIVAKERNIPILGLCENNIVPMNLHPWIECCVNKFFNSRDALLDYAIKYYGF